VKHIEGGAVKHIDSIVAEFNRASSIYPAFNSAHEGYAVLLEEVEELWDEVKKSPKKRDLSKIREEAVQVAAMALRFLHDVVGES
jgi:NTP pyrophosphatase (non-canonical NTP hydrolase)